MLANFRADLSALLADTDAFGALEATVCALALGSGSQTRMRMCLSAAEAELERLAQPG